MADTNCKPGCTPGQTLPLPIGPQSTPETPATITATGLDCNGNTVTASAPGVVQAVPHPDAVQRVMICGDSAEWDSTILCAPDGTHVVAVTSYDQQTGIPSTTYYNLDGTPWAGDPSQLGQCGAEDTTEVRPEPMCDGGTSTFLRWFVIQNGQPTGQSFDTDLAGATYAPSGTVTFGGCLTATTDVHLVSLCIVDDTTGEQIGYVTREALYDERGNHTGDRYIDPVTGAIATIPAGAHVESCADCLGGVVQQILCDLNPSAEPNEEGQRCATRFMRHFVYDCSGELITFRDTQIDGITAYSPVKVVDCQDSRPSLVELVWPRTNVIADPNGVAGHDFIYILANPETGEQAQVKLNTVTPTDSGCGTWVEGNIVGVNTPAGDGVEASRFTFQLDAAAQRMNSFKLTFIDLDTFEGVRRLAPPPDHVEFTVGAGVWNGSDTISATVADSTAVAYWFNPPATITHKYRNVGGGTACHAADLAGVTLVPGDCCAACTDETVQHQEILCDDAEPFIRTYLRSRDGSVAAHVDTNLDGAAYVPVGTVKLCDAQSDMAVSTGILRVTDTNPRDLKTGYPGIQSVTLSVVAGEVNISTTSGPSIVPAGITLRWSVSDTDDASLGAFIATGQAGADYLLAWTYKGTAAG